MTGFASKTSATLTALRSILTPPSKSRFVERATPHYQDKKIRHFDDGIPLMKRRRLRPGPGTRACVRTNPFRRLPAANVPSAAALPVHGSIRGKPISATSNEGPTTIHDKSLPGDKVTCGIDEEHDSPHQVDRQLVSLDCPELLYACRTLSLRTPCTRNRLRSGPQLRRSP